MEKLTVKELRERCVALGISNCGKNKKEILETLTRIEEPLDNEYEELVRQNDPDLWQNIRSFVSKLPDRRPQKTLKKMKKEETQNKWRMIYEELVALGREDEEAKEEQMVAEAINENKYLSTIAVHVDIIRRFFERYPTLVDLYYETNWQGILSLALSIGDISRLFDFWNRILEMKSIEQIYIFEFVRDKETAEKILEMVPTGKSLDDNVVYNLRTIINIDSKKEADVFVIEEADPTMIESIVSSNDLATISKLPFDYLLRNNVTLYAIRNGRISVLKYLYHMNPNRGMWTSDYFRKGPLSLAIRYARVEMVQWLVTLQKGDLDDFFNQSVKTGREDLVRVFLDLDYEFKRTVLIRMATKATKLGYERITLLIADKIPKMTEAVARDLTVIAIRNGRNNLARELLTRYEDILSPFQHKMFNLAIYNNERLHEKFI